MKVVLRLVNSLSTPARAVIEDVPVARSRTRLPDPSGVGMWRDAVADVLEAVEDVGRGVLDAVLVARDQAPTNPAVVQPLTFVVELTGVGVEPLVIFLVSLLLSPSQIGPASTKMSAASNRSTTRARRPRASRARACRDRRPKLSGGDSAELSS